MTYFTVQLLDVAHLSQDPTARQDAKGLLAFLTPICKASMTDAGLEVINLLGRKGLGSQGKLLRGFTKLVHKFCAANSGDPQLGNYVAQLNELNQQWGELT